MALRDDFGSGAGTGRSYSGGAGGLGNGGIGGGMGGGLGGGGAGRNGGIGSRTGLTTGNRMYGGMAMGRPGGPAMNPGAWGVRPQPTVTQGPLSGMPRQRVPAIGGPLPGTNPNVVPTEAPPTQNVFNQNYLGSIANFAQAMRNRYGWGAGNPNITPGPSTTITPTSASLPPYAGPGTDPRITSVPSPYGNTQYSMFGGNYNSVYGNPQLGTPGFGSLSNLSGGTGSQYGGSNSMPSWR